VDAVRAADADVVAVTLRSLDDCVLRPLEPCQQELPASRTERRRRVSYHVGRGQPVVIFRRPFGPRVVGPPSLVHLPRRLSLLRVSLFSHSLTSLSNFHFLLSLTFKLYSPSFPSLSFPCLILSSLTYYLQSLFSK
jgi:hypothetical protein